MLNLSADGIGWLGGAAILGVLVFMMVLAWWRWR
jgi:hypothetical protein